MKPLVYINKARKRPVVLQLDFQETCFASSLQVKTVLLRDEQSNSSTGLAPNSVFFAIREDTPV